MTEIMQKKELNLVKISILILVLFVLSFLLDIDVLKAWVERAGPWIPLAFIALKALTIIVIPFTGAAVYPLVGLLFGLWPGLAYVAIGDLIGFTTAFWISRLFGQAFIERFIAHKQGSLFAHIVEKVETPKGFFHAAIAFLPMPELLSYGAGLTKLRYSIFIMIIWPLWTMVATVLVLIGWFFDFGDDPFVITFVMPVIAVATCVVGGLIFSRNLLAKKGVEDTPG
ncbi:MAG: hypothetical protein A3H44_01325 [Gammaproteobacteria bacterium RIFCSPLOWO2_02_FULL_57_10]|nr:MAG: hypothetical protein A3H44_01325 [Gammaproteobacteria bacterium RIFCSPLOWO2_02_FULL_57_10]